jgi:hypothetical protein
LTVTANVDDFAATPVDAPAAFAFVVPRVADVVALYVNVTEHEPDVGVHDCPFADVNDTPDGRPLIVTATACAVPCDFVIVTVCDAVPPCCIVIAGTDIE